MTPIQKAQEALDRVAQDRSNYSALTRAWTQTPEANRSRNLLAPIYEALRRRYQK